MNLAALVEYDGTRFAGFQRQPAARGPTVQGALEAAIARVAGEAVSVEAAGRTDSGVHATGQVVNFHVPPRHDTATWQRALNALLPQDVAVLAVREVADDFRARWSALSRGYRYRILCRAVRAPLRERYVWRVPRPLDVATMAAAAELLLGERDFGTFGSSPRDTRASRATGRRHSTVRTMLAARVVRSAEAADEIVCELTANAFLTGMVRRLVSMLAQVGEGRLSVAEFAERVVAADAARTAPAAPACGLCLVRVEYPPGALVW
ncbi:MAG TPA: tRNA pseudouridine(38-40) synthase TruA [Ktedonobacterales bacterium]|nr:tRNA pseudouridine(38-40) synthase TruA [Ktedonobacterales bacterium]